MVQAQEIERLATVCRSIHPDDVVDDSSESLSEVNWIREKSVWLAEATEEMRLLIEKVEKQIEESRQVRLKSQQLRSKVNEMLEQVDALKDNKKLIVRYAVPFKSRRMLLKSA